METKTMAVKKLIESFDCLPSEEKREAVAEILRRCRDLDVPPLMDEELVASAESVFLTLDALEAAGSRAKSVEDEPEHVAPPSAPALGLAKARA